MIARLWHGMVPISKADKYLDLMRRIVAGRGVCIAQKQM